MVNIQRSETGLPKILYFIMKIPECTEKSILHMYMAVDGILSYYNFFTNAPEFNLQTRVFSRQTKLIQSLFPITSSETLAYSSTTKVPLLKIGKIKDVKSIRRKRLFIKKIERMANSLIDPLLNYYSKTNIDINTAPVYCKANKKGNYLINRQIQYF